MTHAPLTIGDPAPWFDATALAGTTHNLGVMAGRWVALLFVGALDHAASIQALGEIVAAHGRFFNDDHVIFYAVLTAPPPDPAPFMQASHRGLGFMLDPDASITRAYGAEGSPRLVVLDPQLRLAKIFEIGLASPAAMGDVLRALPPVDDYAGVPLTAPALIIPNLFEPDFCAYLIGLYEADGGRDSGFMLDRAGKSATVIDHNLKRRRDLPIEDDAVRAQIRERVVRRMIPALERFFQYRPTRMDRYLVSCYDAESGGHFARHRDNVNAGARHRRFAASFNLNDDYEGCDLIFPEFGRRLYRAPKGGAIAFSTGALHQVTPITRGKRYAFVPFFYGEDDAQKRLANNARLSDGEGLYTGTRDALFPAS